MWLGLRGFTETLQWLKGTAIALQQEYLQKKDTQGEFESVRPAYVSFLWTPPPPPPPPPIEGPPGGGGGGGGGGF